MGFINGASLNGATTSHNLFILHIFIREANNYGADCTIIAVMEQNCKSATYNFVHEYDFKAEKIQEKVDHVLEDLTFTQQWYCSFSEHIKQSLLYTV